METKWLTYVQMMQVTPVKKFSCVAVSEFRTREEDVMKNNQEETGGQIKSEKKKNLFQRRQLQLAWSQGHFFSTTTFPTSSYSCLEIHICWKVP